MACFVHTGCAVKEMDLEMAVYDWVVKVRESEVTVRRSNIIEKAMSHDSCFKDGNH